MIQESSSLIQTEIHLNFYILEEVRRKITAFWDLTGFLYPTNQNLESNDFLKKLCRNLSLETESQNIILKAFSKVLILIYRVQNS